MLTRLVGRLFATTTALTKTPNLEYSLKSISVNELPKLTPKPHKYLLKNWWSQAPFDRKAPLAVPVFSLMSGEFTGKAVELNHEIFNQPLRRDLIYRLYQWRIMLNKFRTHLTRNIRRTSGSGRKPAAQKGRGAARVGKIRAPGRHKGGKAHGAKPKVYSFHLNEKIKLTALRALLSSRLFQGRIRIINQDEVTDGKTSTLNKYLQKNLTSRATACLITSSSVSEQTVRSHRNLRRIKAYNSRNFDVLSLMKMDKIIISTRGLEQMTSNILKSMYVVTRLPHEPKLPQEQTEEEQTVQYDPAKPLTFKFKILEQYLKTYEQLKTSNPQKVQKQFSKTINGRK